VFSPNYPYDGVATGESNKMFDYADFLLGYRSTTGLSSSPIANIRDWGFSGYLQDDWKVSHRLTVNLGLRYEFYTPIYEANNQLSNFDLSTKAIKLATSSDPYTVNPNTKDFGPRVGAAFTLSHDNRGARGLWHQLFALEPHRFQLPDHERAVRHHNAGICLPRPLDILKHPERVHDQFRQLLTQRHKL